MQALAYEMFQHEYDHVAYFNNKIGSTVPAPSKPVVRSPAQPRWCRTYSSCPFSHSLRSCHPPAAPLAVAAWTRPEQSRARH